MSCIKKGNVRCTSCCEAIHIPRTQWRKLRKGLISAGPSQSILKYWKPISKRVAKRINPYVLYERPDNGEHKQYIKDSQFFTCTALEIGVGCTIRDQEDHPKVCKVFTAQYDYSPTCPDDVNIIARSTQ